MTLEIDFIAEKFDKVIYIQSAIFIPDEGTMIQETRPFKYVKKPIRRY